MHTQSCHRSGHRRAAAATAPRPALARSPRHRAATMSVALLGGFAVLLSACGGSGAGQPAAAPSSTPRSSSRGPGGVARAGAAAVGTVAALSASSMQVQNPASGQVTVDFSGSTRFTETVAATLADARPGDCVVVAGRVSSTSSTVRVITARSVRLSPAGPAGCPATAGSVRSGHRRSPGRGGRRSHAVTTRALPGVASASGRITATTSTSLTLTGTLRLRRLASGSTKSVVSGSVTVVVTSSTTLTRLVTTSSKALVVGGCVAAFGPTTDTGRVVAKSIAIRPGGPGGCFGGRRGSVAAGGGSDG